MQLKDKIVLVTGGSKGLGKEIAMKLASEGSNVIICARNEEKLSRVSNEIKQTGGKCSYYVADVEKENEVISLIDNIMKKFGRIDVLINNAGYGTEVKPIEETSQEDLLKCFETNVYSIFYFLKHLVPEMKRQDQGTIINISSMAGKRGVPNLSAYSASKFAVIGLTQSVAKEVKGTGVYCISVCPGGINTEMREKAFGSEDADKQQSPEFVANVIKGILLEKIKVPHGGDIVIRHGEIVSINTAPE
jgi:3-oxoacyl-[acyl-carrier protein] reductase